MHCWRIRAFRGKSIRLALDEYLTYGYIPAPRTIFQERP